MMFFAQLTESMVPMLSVLALNSVMVLGLGGWGLKRIITMDARLVRIETKLEGKK